MSKQEKKRQLGMDPSTASNRLVKDILWDYIVKCGDDHCHVCKNQLTRDDFSIEHKDPWLHSEDPLGLFFDIDNIAFSHKSCNYGAARKMNKIYATLKEREAAAFQRRYYKQSKEDRQRKRREKYKRTGH